MTYDNKLELTVASILFYNQHLIDYELVEQNDFFSDIKHSVGKMIKMKKNGGIINTKSVGRTFDTPTPDDVEKFNDYVRSLKSLSLDRKIQDIPHNASMICTKALAKYQKLDNNGILNELEQLIKSYRMNTSNTEDHKISSMLSEYIDTLMESMDDDMIEYGIPELDDVIGNGSRRGELVIFAGKEKNFKSTLAYNVALNVARRGLPVMFISYEIPKSGLLDKFIALTAPINSNILRTKKMYNESGELVPISECDEVMSKITETVNVLNDLPLHLYTNHPTLSEIQMDAMKIKPAMIFIDYIQIMKDINANDPAQLAHRIMELKHLANESQLNCVICALAQFKNLPDDMYKPTHDDIKGSSAVKQTADLVLLTTKSINNTNVVNGEQDAKIQIEVSLNRHGEADKMIELPIVPKWGLIKENKEEKR